MANKGGSSCEIDQLTAKVEAFGMSDERFKALPPELSRIAVGTAVEVLSIPTLDLLFRAGEIDASADANPLAHFFQELDVPLLTNDRSIRERLLRSVRPSTTIRTIILQERANRIADALLTGSIASRLSRIRLAQGLGYVPGKAGGIVGREDFRAANDFCWQAVQALQPK